MKPSDGIHPIQIEIFERLRSASVGMRFAEMCPKGIESDLYNYHLRYLVKNGRVEKTGAMYFLTTSGKEFVADLAPLRLGKPQLTKIAAMCLVVRNNRVLYQKRTRTPHLGAYLMVAGGIKRGEPLLEAASRRLMEEVGITGGFTWIGTLRKIRRYPITGKVWSDITYQLCLSTDSVGEATTTKFGEHLWLELDEAASIEQEQSVGSSHIAKILRSYSKEGVITMQGFYEEEVHEQDPY